MGCTGGAGCIGLSGSPCLTAGDCGACAAGRLPRTEKRGKKDLRSHNEVPPSSFHEQLFRDQNWPAPQGLKQHTFIVAKQRIGRASAEYMKSSYQTDPSCLLDAPC